ncbi:GNAT family N-acetyltransferase [Bacillus sp. CRN 9]|nr:GNAT family N-acetyltransferase [Bacillus sp. CRN 9]
MDSMDQIDLARMIENIKIQGTIESIDYRKANSATFNGGYIELTNHSFIFNLDHYYFGIGFGLHNDELLSSDLEKAQDFISSQNNMAYLRFELTPFTNKSILTTLERMGYTIEQFASVWVRDLKQWQSNNEKHDQEVTISIVDAQLEDDWARTVSLGFSEDQFITGNSIEAAKGFLNAESTTGFLLKEGGECAAAGMLAVSGELGELFLTSTIPSFRGRKYQNLLINERLRYAKSQGCKYVTTTTKPNNTSARNMMRNGFTLMYNKVILKSPLLT